MTELCGLAPASLSRLLHCAAVNEAAPDFTLACHAAFQAGKHNTCFAPSFIPTLSAGVVIFKPLDSSQNWATLDQGAKDILESLLHDLPERLLTATQLLNNPWLYEAQGKPFPTESIFNPPVSDVPLVVSQRIQRRARHTLLVPVIVDPFRAYVDFRAKQPKGHMAGQLNRPHSAGQAEAVVRRLHPYPHPPGPGSPISGSAASGPRPTPAGPFAAALPAAPKPKPLGYPDRSPYSVVPRRPDAPNARDPWQGSAPRFPSGTSAHGQYGSAGDASSAGPSRLPHVQASRSRGQAYQPAHMYALTHKDTSRARQHRSMGHPESQSGSESAPASQSLTGFSSQYESESPHSEYSSAKYDSSSESFSGSGGSSMSSDADSHCSSLIDTAMESGDEVSHELDPESALVTTDKLSHMP